MEKEGREGREPNDEASLPGDFSDIGSQLAEAQKRIESLMGRDFCGLMPHGGGVFSCRATPRGQTSSLLPPKTTDTQDMGITSSTKNYFLTARIFQTCFPVLLGLSWPHHRHLWLPRRFHQIR